ncbi:Hypothetical protein PHPALM_14746 [Phytophthora palmivora]|uniref:Uncharacterized protein n=1 Tax=Phytophthora palmivora TaxID=4796 RepID=A0A2P4XTX7_9STRA|nr:Hypothetical protein PHPALM_14746 [Phytophthora palmivora]
MVSGDHEFFDEETSEDEEGNTVAPDRMAQNNEYRQHVCEDIDFKCHVLYIKYRCMGTNNGSFSFC